MNNKKTNLNSNLKTLNLMKTNLLKKALLSVAVLFTASCAATQAADRTPSAPTTAQRGTYQCTIHVSGNYRYEYVSDPTGRVCSKTAYRWDADSHAWKPAFLYTVSYGSSTNTLTYAAWNEADAAFTARRASQSYDARRFPVLIAQPANR